MYLEEELNKFVEAEEVEQLWDPKQEKFTIENDQQANYIIRKIKSIRQQKEEISKTAKNALDDYAAKVEKFEETSLNPLNYQENYFVSLLEAYVHEQLKDGKKRSIKFIEGTAGFRKMPMLISYDETVVMDFMKQHPDIKQNFMKVTESLDKAKIRKSGIFDNNKCMLDDTVIPGISVEKQPDTFSVK